MYFDIDNHLKLFPHSVVVIKDTRIWGCWMIGRNYQPEKPYFGAYPPKYLERVMSLFPEEYRILHLFSGSLQPESPNEWTYDINPEVNPDCCGNAEDVGDYFPDGYFDLILADPPYSKKAADVYGYKLPRFDRVLHECRKIIRSGGMIVWLSSAVPMYTRSEFRLAGLVLLFTGTHRILRGVTFLEAVE